MRLLGSLFFALTHTRREATGPPLHAPLQPAPFAPTSLGYWWDIVAVSASLTCCNKRSHEGFRYKGLQY